MALAKNMKKRRITNEQLKDIKEKYLSGMTSKEIYEYYNHIYKSEESVQKIVRELGISRGRYKKPVILNHSYFEKIDCERKAYWVGFLLADGCIIKKPKKSDTIKLELKFEDKYILEELAKDIKSDLTVKDYKYGKKHNAMVHARSNKMSNDLSKYGIVPRKTMEIDSIKNIPDEFLRHFIRGYFDGDGCIYLNLPHDQNIHRAKITFCGTKKFLDDLNDRLINQFDISKTIYVDMNKYGHNVHNIRIIRNKDIYKMYDIMYKGATIYLKRKKEKFEIFINERKVTNAKR